MSKLFDDISRSEELRKELSMLEKKKEELKVELEILQEDCEHSIIIVTNVNPGYSIRARCLFCGKRYYIPHELREIPNHIDLDAYKYNCFRHVFLDREIYDIITNRAKEYLVENPDIQSKQLAQKLENYFKQLK